MCCLALVSIYQLSARHSGVIHPTESSWSVLHHCNYQSSHLTGAVLSRFEDHNDRDPETETSSFEETPQPWFIRPTKIIKEEMRRDQGHGLGQPLRTRRLKSHTISIDKRSTLIDSYKKAFFFCLSFFFSPPPSHHEKELWFYGPMRPWCRQRKGHKVQV